MRLVSVAVPVPLLDALTYALPDELEMPPVGARVLVPVGTRVLTGCVLGDGGGDAAPDRVKAVIEVLDDRPFVPEDVVELAVWVAEYYACGVGEAVAAAMPPRAWIESERHAQITAAGRVAAPREGGLRRTVLEKLAGGAPVRVGSIGAQGVHAALLTLERDGLLTLTRPLKGLAAAYRTVRVVTLTAQGMDIAARAAGGSPLPASRFPPPASSFPLSDSSFPLSEPDAPDAPHEPDDPPHLRLGGRQRAALDLLRGAPDGIDAAQLRREGTGPQTLARLASLGLVSFSRRRIERDPFELAVAPAAARTPVVLTDEQSAALNRLVTLAGSRMFRPVVLHGVTGSGKTEIYLRLAERVHAQGRSVLLLVPEIALTPAIATTFRQAFGARVAIQHSGLSDGERHDQWQRIRRGDVDVVVGTRSAVFAPLRAPGLIIVDEEHDGSYKQEESPRYNGRDVAVMRGRRAGALVVLGSATPSLESHYNAVNRRYELLTLRKRVLDRPLADVRIVDMRERVRRRRAGRDPERTAPRRARGPAGRRRAGHRAAQPAGVCDISRVPAVRIDARVPELQPVADRSSRGTPCALPLLQLRHARAGCLSGLRRGIPGAGRLRHRAGRGGDPCPVSRRAGGPRRSRHDPAEAARSGPCCARFAARERSTSWSGPR